MSVEEYLFLMNCQKSLKYPFNNVLLSIVQNSLVFSQKNLFPFQRFEGDVGQNLKPLDLDDFS